MAIKPGKYNPALPDIELFDHKTKKRWGLKLDGPSGLQVGTVSQDDTVHIRTAGKNVGDFDEQRSWKAGRGKEKLSENPEGFWDSQDAWTLADGHVHQTLLWQVARGLRSCDVYLPSKTRSVSWKPLTGASRYVENTFSSSGFVADYARVWLRRVGTPGSMTLRLYSDSAGNPNAVLAEKIITVSNVTDIISKFQLFDWTSTYTLVVSTTYHIVVLGASTDDKNNHWEIGGYSGGTVGRMSSNGSTWLTATTASSSVTGFDMFYYIADADIVRTFYPFFLDGMMYVVGVRDNYGGVSRLWMNGDRGKCTAASATLTDTARAWTTNQWYGARVAIIRGTGLGQDREIASNNGTQLAVTEAWTTNPSTDSEYIIYSTDWFTEITGTGLSYVSGQPLVANQMVYFPQHGTGNVRRMIWNATTKAHAWDDTGVLATFLAKTQSTAGLRIWKVLNYSVGKTALNYVTAPPYSTTPAAVTFSAEQTVGDSDTKATGVLAKDDILYVFKSNGLFRVDSNSIITSLQNGIDSTPSPDNGFASIAHQQFIYYSWLHSVLRVYGSTHDDIGQDWKGWGLPNGREGTFVSFDTYTSLLIAGVDAGSGTSSVLGWDGIGWHELLRGYDANKRIRMVKVQPNRGSRNRTWVDVGGDLIYQEMPYLKGSPRLDSGARYMHEAVIESAAIDMGTASGLSKFVKELTVLAENLGDGNEICVDYQVDDAVHTTSWTEATTLFQSPESTAFFGLSDIRRFAYRLRIRSDDNTAPIDILGVVPNGYARVPFKMIWTLRCRADNISAQGKLAKPDTMMRWLLDNARHPGRIEMKSQYELAHKFYVIVHPPRMFPYKPGANGQAEESVFTLVLEES